MRSLKGRLLNSTFPLTARVLMKRVVLFAITAVLTMSGTVTRAADNGVYHSAEDMQARWSPDSPLPNRGRVEPPRTVRADGWDWDHEVRIYLPASYDQTNRHYPVLWITDNSLELIQAALTGDGLGFAPELIVVAVGPPADINPAERQRRRTYDFSPDKESMGERFASVPDEALGGAPGFLDFLVDQLRPTLAAEYRIDPNDQGLAGHSGGAMFGLYVLFNAPASFSKYIISSPANYQVWLDMEARWHAEHDDLEAEVFMSAGEREMDHPVWSSSQIVSTVATLTERLTARGYRSLGLTATIFPGEDHISVMPVAYTRGVRKLWD